MKKKDELRTIRIDPLITPSELARQYAITQTLWILLSQQDKILLVL